MRDQTNSFEYTEAVLDELLENAQRVMEDLENNPALAVILEKLRVK